MDTSAIVGWSGLVISILGIIYSAVNHKHIKSRCCGRVYDFSIDVENTNPEEDRKREDELRQRREAYEEKVKQKEEEEREKQKKEYGGKKKKEEEEEKEKKKISYTPHVFKIQPLHF